MTLTVGMIGLGIMGSAMSENLLRAGCRVAGCDVDAGRSAALAAVGGVVASSPRVVAEQADLVIAVLPGSDILHEVATGPDGLIASGNTRLVLADCGTFDIDAKERTRDALATAGMSMLDCTISGTGSQAKTGDLVVYASGDERHFPACRPAFSGFARASHYVGAFGNASKVTFVANLLVAVHTAAAAEAMVLAQRAGLDLEAVYDLVREGAGTSRMFELRGPLMAAGVYDKDVASRLELWQKDMQVIGRYAQGLACPVPLFAASAQLYNAAIGEGYGKLDMAALCAVLENLAGIARRGA